jgi:hypothetical protein
LQAQAFDDVAHLPDLLCITFGQGSLAQPQTG